MKSASPRPSGRRSFISVVSALTGLTFLRPLDALAEHGRSQPAAGEWDLSWLSGLRGKHRQLFDCGPLAAAPLHVVRNYLDAHRDVYGLAYPRVNTVVGIAGRSFPINAGDALWARYELGKRWKVNDPKTGTFAVRNVFAGVAPETFNAPAGSPEAKEQAMTVRALQARGTIFWQCNNALNGVAEDLAKDAGTPVDAVRAELVAGLMPGVHLVPAHTMLVGLAQDHGCRYEALF
ncbi:MAG: hypothetical protein H0U85_04395 [Gemmatimonadales bacterium]|nr:hypothetical protein [Gemmatimonadales bacterium]